MTRRHQIYLLLLLISSFLSCTSTRPTTATKPGEEPIEFIILQLNDVYEIAPLEGGKYGGLARVATLKKRLMRENPNTIAVLSGDFLSPSFIGTLKMENGDRIAGLQMVESLNAMGMDYVTFGNHEFDLSNVEVLKKRIDQSEFKYVCANALLKEEGVTKPFSQHGNPVPPYFIHEMKNSNGGTLKLGITGVVLPFNRQDYVSYLPVTETFKKTVSTMEKEAQATVALTHLAYKEDIELAKSVPGIPLFLGGHDHTSMSFYVENTIITKADANAKTVYVHRGTYDPCSGKLSIRSSLVTVDDSIEEDPATKKVVDKWLASVDDIAKNMGFDPTRELLVLDQTLECTEAKVRSQPTNYGQLANRAFEAVLPNADLYVLNSGSMRLDDNLKGVVTEYDVLRTFPFGGPIVWMELAGADISKLLQVGLIKNHGDGGYLQALHVSSEDQAFSVRGESLDPKKKYKLVLPKFVAEGREANLDFLSDFTFESQETFNTADGKKVTNDMRNIVIHFMETIGEF